MLATVLGEGEPRCLGGILKICEGTLAQTQRRAAISSLPKKPETILQALALSLPRFGGTSFCKTKTKPRRECWQMGCSMHWLVVCCALGGDLGFLGEWEAQKVLSPT